MSDGSLGSLLFVALNVALPILLLAALVLFLGAVIAKGVRTGLDGASKAEDPLVVLQRRYARGEIDDAEYAHRQEILAGR